MSAEVFLNGRVQLCCGDSLHFLRDQPDNRYDSIVTDPPYALVSIVKRFGKGGAPVKVPEGGSGAYARASAGFMGKQWDTGETAFSVEFWEQCLRVLKPGGHVVAFSGTRTYHRLAVAIEDAGFEIRDMIGWLYGSGFPKSHDVSKGLARELAGPGLREEWEGWGTALKPAQEPICFARKPLVGTVAGNVLQHGTGAINIDGCRVGDFVNTTPPGTDRYNAANFEQGYRPSAYGRDGEASADPRYTENGSTNFAAKPGPRGGSPEGRWPANIVHDGSEEVLAAFPADLTSGKPAGIKAGNNNNVFGQFAGGIPVTGFGDSGSAARFFYTAKADADDRIGSKHPTVKPVDLMQWLVRLVTPKGGLVLDPFAGTGTTAEACFREGMRCMLVEREAEYQADIRRRMALILAGPEERARESIKAKTAGQPVDHGPLFAGAAE